MEQRFEEILRRALALKATDIHFSINDGELNIKARGVNGLVQIPADNSDIRLFNYLQYLSRMDITAFNLPQSGSFSYFLDGEYYDFRFACLSTMKVRSGVLRILNMSRFVSLDSLTYDREAVRTFRRWLKYYSGLFIFSGLTGSGKTTTLYSLLKEADSRIIYSLEDPIEVLQEGMIQLEINEKIGFGYDEGIKQILRHNPDILMIGEVRDEKTAKMCVRAALTGCLVFTSLHARSASSAVNRLLELNVSKTDLADSLKAIVSQRLVKRKGVRDYTCIYDIMENDRLKQALNGQGTDLLEYKINKAVEDGIVEAP